MFWKSKFFKGIKLINQGNLKEGIAELDKMMKRKPKYYAKVQYAYFLIKAGEIEKAEKLYEENIFKDISKKKPNDKLLSKINYTLLVWKKGQLDDAIDMTEDLLDEYKNTAIYVNLGFFLLLKGDYEKALKVNLEALDFAPENLGVLDNLGINYYYLKDYEKAQETYEKLFKIKENPSFAECFYNYALVLKELGKKQEAKAFLNKALTSEFSALGSVEKEDVEKELKSLS